MSRIFYGWIIVAIAFVTVAVGVTARTSYSLMFPPIVEEFGWDLGVGAGAFSFGLIVTAFLTPLIGRWMDRRGPRFVIELGVLVLSAGFLAATFLETPWQLYLTLGALVGGGANCMTYTAQSLYLPNWFVRRRGLAISIAFSGAGIGAIVLLPWLQAIIQSEGWRAACWKMGVLAFVVLGSINLLVRQRPQDMGLHPDGALPADGAGAAGRRSNVVDPAWAAIEWTVGRALRTARFWWIAVGFFSLTFVWYLVQIHQTKFLIEAGFPPTQAAWALGLVSLVAVPGQIFLGGLSDRIGREPVWALSCAGFAICCGALLALEHNPSEVLLYAMIVTQGLLGYAILGIMGPIVSEIFEGPHYGAIFGVATIAILAGGAAGPVAAGFIHDATGSYRWAFLISIAFSVLSALSIWIAAPRLVRTVAGRAR